MVPDATLERKASLRARTETGFCNYLASFATSTELTGCARMVPDATLERKVEYSSHTVDTGIKVLKILAFLGLFWWRGRGVSVPFIVRKC
ncbi:MAG: hypothetical protein LBB40_03235 [Holophagales bacterium]|jgi:hypothetical protein|nr:hypothetical protein [Holophagales bacterium]